MPVELSSQPEAGLAIKRAAELAGLLRAGVDDALPGSADLSSLDDAQARCAEVEQALELAAELARDAGITLARAGAREASATARARLRTALDEIQVLAGDLDDALALSRDLGRALARAVRSEFARSRAPVFARELVFAIERALDDVPVGEAPS